MRNGADLASLWCPFLTRYYPCVPVADIHLNTLAFFILNLCLLAQLEICLRTDTLWLLKKTMFTTPDRERGRGQNCRRESGHWQISDAGGALFRGRPAYLCRLQGSCQETSYKGVWREFRLNNFGQWRAAFLSLNRVFHVCNCWLFFAFLRMARKWVESKAAWAKRNSSRACKSASKV